jgi:hypothetical protein
MTRNRVRAMVLAMAIVASSLVLVGATAGSASAAGCSSTKKSSMSFSGTAKTVETVHVYSDGIEKIIGTKTLRNTFKTGTTTVTVTACKNSGKWKVLTYAVDRRFPDLTLTVNNGKITGIKPSGGKYQGFGAVTTRLTTTTIDNYGLVCGVSPQPLTILGVLHDILKLPLPGPYGVSVGAFIADKLIPGAQSGTKYKCGEMTDNLNLPWKFNSAGVVSLSIPSQTFALADRYVWDDYCNTHPYCGATIQTEMYLHKG